MARLRGFPAPTLSTPKVSLPVGRLVKLEVGFGKGLSLLAAATAEPATFFIGVEAARACCDLARTRADRAGLSNVELVHGDARELLASLPPGALSKISILFPDPWPKRRHRKRRILNAAFIRLAATRLHPLGALVLKTDFEPYFRDALPLLDAEPRLRRALAGENHRRAERLAPLTSFERKYRLVGRRIFAAAYVRADRPRCRLPP